MPNYDPDCYCCCRLQNKLPDRILTQMGLKINLNEVERELKAQTVLEDDIIKIYKISIGKKGEKPEEALSQREDPSRQGLEVIFKEHRPSFTESEKRHIRKVLKSLDCKGRIRWKRKASAKHASCSARLN